MKAKPVATSLLTLMVVCGGCHKPVPPVEPTRQSFIVADEEQVDAFWETCQAVLRGNRFLLDRVDRNAGVITTFPVTSQQFFEFWRHDVDTAHDVLIASLSAMRRRAAIEVQSPPDNPMALNVSITINTERLSAPERQFNNSAQALRLFGEEMPGEAGEPRLTQRDDYWINEGRDGAMERRILQQINNEAVYVESPSLPPP